jgi:beta-glucanase (GH16 family)
LAWNDEFEGNALNTNIWNYDIGNNATSGWGNNELQYYRPQNAAVANGVLSITAQRSTSNELGSVENKAYTSARLHTARKKTFTYGRFEMRAKLPQGQGMWPAFWMLGASCTGFSGSYGGTINWPDCGEIDVMEMVGGNDIANPARGDFTTHGTLHYRNAQGVNPMLSGSKRHTERLSQNFNTYTLDWSATEFVWYFNGVEFARRSVANDMQAFVNKPYFLLLNLAVGGNWPGAPDSATVFPQKFEIDYIRVYQKL